MSVEAFIRYDIKNQLEQGKQPADCKALANEYIEVFWRALSKNEGVENENQKSFRNQRLFRI